MDKNNLKSVQHRAHILELYLKNSYLSHGKESLVHGNTGRPSSRRIDKDIEHRLVALS